LASSRGCTCGISSGRGCGSASPLPSAVSVRRVLASRLRYPYAPANLPPPPPQWSSSATLPASSATTT
jgi:hypothetical protein